MTESSHKVLIVTGSASGLGRDIAEAALNAGYKVIATARDPRKLSGLVEVYGDAVRTAALDVTDQGAAFAAIDLAMSEFGSIDVLVNNAGYGHIVPFEQTSEEDFRAQIETNFFGVVNLTRAVLPVMRQQRYGRIIQVSSVGGRIGSAGLAAYQSAKWAVGGFSEVLAQEVAAYGVKVSIVEPGGIRTNWGTRASSGRPKFLPEYESSVGALLAMVEPYVGKENSDPRKVAEVVLALASHPKPPLHLLLGGDAVQYAGAVESARAASDERWRAVSRFTDFDSTAPLPVLPAE
jgi:NAD(P)-dependent dehydrogenase (short-subunit alcohol dehydrogenase family)